MYPLPFLPADWLLEIRPFCRHLPTDSCISGSAVCRIAWKKFGEDDMTEKHFVDVKIIGTGKPDAVLLQRDLG